MESNSSTFGNSSRLSTEQSTPALIQAQQDYIIVAGEVYVHLFMLPEDDPQEGSICAIIEREGGASLLTQLLDSAQFNPAVLGPHSLDGKIKNVRSISRMSRVNRRSKDGQHYVVKKVEHLRGQSIWGSPREVTKSDNNAPKILIFHEPTKDERTQPGEELFENTRPQVMIYKMARPVTKGSLWAKVRSGPYSQSGERDPDRLIVIVNAEDLRREGIELSCHLSWEKTCEDFVRELACNGEFVSLLNCAHLIICFDCDGVIHHQRGKNKDTLYFNGSYAEGDFIKACTGEAGDMTGLMSTFTAGFASGLAKSDLSAVSGIDSGIEAGILQGLKCSRRLCRTGFLSKGRELSDDPPWKYIMTGGDPNDDDNDLDFNWITIPTEKVIEGLNWTALEDMAGDPAEVAHCIVKDGPGILSRVPIARFGTMVTADRSEIESYRAISNLIEEYSQAKVHRATPLCIGVFGPPGSGKSYALKQVTTAVLQEQAPPTLEFNLSQFKEYSELIVAFQLVRDTALSGKVPLVMFDEFDANFGGELGWLKYFLTPMNDGRFLDHGRTHPLGRAIFVFIGGTSSTFRAFKDRAHSNEGLTAKCPDFVSRLSGYVDIRGPDPDPDQKHDSKYPIRRALLLHDLLRKHDLKGIDDAVLTGLLRVSRFHHGARSMKAILDMSRLSGKEKFERASLPSDDQLSLHVDPQNFLQWVRGPRLQWDLPMYSSPFEDKAGPNFAPLRDVFAIRLHRVYCDAIKKVAKTAPNLVEGGLEATTQAWHDLPPAHKETSRLQADDIAYKLRLIKCYFSRTVPGKERRFEFRRNRKTYNQEANQENEDDEVEKLAIREHQRFITERLRNGWRYGKDRDLPAKVSPNLVPWSDLPQEFKELYCDLVESIPEILKSHDYEIYRLEEGPQIFPHSPPSLSIV
ncbi:hypothetical protein Aspvir_005998 [Aspergillus viridinutans]|uniref:Ryanodine receptor Ryr domain-containing protein n=1 Tax=Aspergillus viridinutans TaxID=75553 RepID=A0A9P3BTZ0_ASPVI|nr:uncharacterized protein Aspvir_005998 [Aspergillus viridinutans]GIK01957.1 hypothetical protein Aspvir_005998 [Aspergillus viridinutans]